MDQAQRFGEVVVVGAGLRMDNWMFEVIADPPLQGNGLLDGGGKFRPAPTKTVFQYNHAISGVD